MERELNRGGNRGGKNKRKGERQTDRNGIMAQSMIHEEEEYEQIAPYCL